MQNGGGQAGLEEACSIAWFCVRSQQRHEQIATRRLRQMEEDTSWLLRSRTELGINLREEKQTLEELGVAAQVHLRRGQVLEGILSEIREGKYDLVVTGSA